MSGCLFPQEDRLIPDTPPVQANQAPRILVETADPTLVTTIGPDFPCSLVFSAAVVDPDPKQIIRQRWFIDDTGRNSLPVAEGTLTASPDGGSQEPASYIVALNAPGNALQNLGLHTVELVVADAEFNGRKVLPNTQGYTDEYTWFVNVQSTHCLETGP